jgi:hypothetical protein
VSYKIQELLTIREDLRSPLVFVGVRVPHFVQFIVLFYYVSLRSEFHVRLCFYFFFFHLVYPMLPVSLDCPF